MGVATTWRPGAHLLAPASALPSPPVVEGGVVVDEGGFKTMGVTPRMRPRFPVAVAGGLLLAALAGCAATVPPEEPAAQDEPPVAAAPPPVAEPAPEPPKGPKVFRAALLLPLSGPRAAAGRAIADAAELALFDRAGPSFVLLPRDTAGTPEGAEAALRNALADGVDVVLGPLLGTAARRIAPVARAAGAPVVALTNDRRVAGGGVWVLGLTPGRQVDAVVAWARAEGRARYAALVPHGAYGDAAERALGLAVVRYGGAVGDVVRYRPEAAGRDNAAAEALASALADPARGFDALLIAASGDTLAALAPLLPHHGVDSADVRFLGVGPWRDPALLGEPALVDAVFAAPDAAAGDDGAFAARYRDLFGAPPPRVAALGYDAVALAVAASGAADTAAALADPAGVRGAAGVFRFGDDGIAERRLAIWRVARNGFEIVVPAPESFDVPAF